MAGRRGQGDLSTVSALKNLILTRRLHPGDPMPTETELIEELGVSRSSIREAVRTLVALDILTVRHGKGTFVGQLSMRPLVEGMVFRGVLQQNNGTSLLRELVEVRMGLDHSLAPRIIERLNGGERAAALSACVEEINERADRGELFAEADRRFHLLLAEELGNELYGQLVAAFWDIHTTVVPTYGEADWDSLQETARAHAAMLDAAIAGDLEAYRAAVSAHYEPLLRILASRDAEAAAS